mmetsp:Transcript_23478/g.38246  ORF Transcript_23478/g.38246 Transcript_23478/m.38246 type:complete len:1173 (-) Transcript_23478:370-3888(-)
MSTTTESSHTVNLVVASASLLSGELRECAYDDTGALCSSGGVAAVQAYTRLHTNNDDSSPVLVVPMGDFKAPLTEMSRFYFGVNVMIFANELGWRTWTVPAYTLWPRRLEYSSVYDAQEPTLPALISNVVTSPNERWHPYIESVHFDEETNIALLYITKEYLNTTVSQVGSTMQLLHYIYKYNEANRCETYRTTYLKEQVASAHSVFQEVPFSEWWREQGDQVLDAIRSGDGRTDVNIYNKANNLTQQLFTTSSSSSQSAYYDPDNCFVPVVVFDDVSKSQFDVFVEAFNQTIITFPPSLIVDMHGHALQDENETQRIQTLAQQDGVDLGVPPPTWLVSYRSSSEAYDQLKITVSSDRQRIESVSLVHENLLDLPDNAKTDEYYRDLDNIRQYAREAVESSQAREFGVKTRAMPEQTNNVDGFRYCYVGECQMGNLYADALRWIENVDVAMLPSFMFTGPGWKEGEIRTLEILENLPYATSRCAGTMTGYSLLRVLNHSIRTTSFGGYDSAKVGGKLLQVSGLKIVYNKELKGNPVVSVDVYDKLRNDYVPLENTRLYTFVSCAHLCFTFTEFPPLLGELLNEAGEVPAVQSSDTDIKADLKQYLLSEFSESYYEPAIEGRLVNNQSRSDTLPFVNKQDCEEGKFFWSSILLDCEPCPDFKRLKFSKKKVDLVGNAYAVELLSDRVDMTNLESYPIKISADTLALPSNIEFYISSTSSGDASNTSNAIFVLKPNETISIGIQFDPAERTAGRDTSSVVFEVSRNPQPPGCSVQKIKYDIVASLSLSAEENHLGALSAFGYTATVLIVLASLAFASWVAVRRNTRVVSTMQPVFLITLCFGVLLVGLSLIPFSIDDGVATNKGCDIACMSIPWLLSVGFTLCITALFSKLLRINKLFHSQQFRRLKVRGRDVIFGTTILVIVNIILNIVWSVVDPLRWERTSAKEQPNISYGRCVLGGGKAGKAIFISVILICAIGFIMTCWQAFKARDISSEFSESKYLGIAIYSWFQLCVVGIPVLILMDESNVLARYSLVVGVIFALCMSMLLVVFVPILRVKKKRSRQSSLVYGLPQIGQNWAGSSELRSSSERFRRLKLFQQTDLDQVGAKNDDPAKKEDPPDRAFKGSHDSSSQEDPQKTKSMPILTAQVHLPASVDFDADNGDSKMSEGDDTVYNA